MSGEAKRSRAGLWRPRFPSPEGTMGCRPGDSQEVARVTDPLLTTREVAERWSLPLVVVDAIDPELEPVAA